LESDPVHEQDKIEEAVHFLDRMSQSSDPKSFRFELSAFLSPARSALQYALEEARTKNDGQAWYETQVSGKVVVKFFKDKRDVSIHRKPVVPTVSANLAVKENVRVAESLHLQVLNSDGEVVREVSVRSESPPLPPPQPPTIRYTYSFTDWTGPEDVLTLSRRYLEEVQSVVNDGVSRGYLS
jgi:hypothetical protein